MSKGIALGTRVWGAGQFQQVVVMKESLWRIMVGSHEA